MSRELPEDPIQYKPLQVGLACCGEYVVPGGSHLVQGDLKGAAVHGALGFAAGVLFGFPGRLLLSSNSLRTALDRRRPPAVAPEESVAALPAATAEAAPEVPEPPVAVKEPPLPSVQRTSASQKAAPKVRAKAVTSKASAVTPRKSAGRPKKSTS